MTMKYFFETYGCQMNIAESASIEQLLLQRGWELASGAEMADLVVINTCTVRSTAETRIVGRLGWYLALKTNRSKVGERFVLVVTGCLAERLREELKKDFPVIDYAIGNFQKQHFTDIAISIEQESEKNGGRFPTKSCSSKDFTDAPVYVFAPLSAEPGAFRAFVPIMHGCNNFCTYCIVPYVRGREISRPPQDILCEIDMLSAQGVKEITVLGQNVNSYCWDGGGVENSLHGALDFPSLIELIAGHLRKTNSSIGWVRFMSSHPKDLSDDLLDVMSRERVLCRHIHVPVQHGSSDILKRMNRRYSREDYLGLVSRIRAKLPDASLTTDILIGFPGETDADFEQTLSIMREVRYQTAYMYYYNPREGTPAATYADQIPLEVKKARLADIIELQHSITHEEIEKRLGQRVSVLVGNVSRDSTEELVGRTEQDERVVFKASSNYIGSFAKVQLEELHGNTFRGTMII